MYGSAEWSSIADKLVENDPDIKKYVGNEEWLKECKYNCSANANALTGSLIAVALAIYTTTF